jgi:hypothetical protein
MCTERINRRLDLAATRTFRRRKPALPTHTSRVKRRTSYVIRHTSYVTASLDMQGPHVVRPTLPPLSLAASVCPSFPISLYLSLSDASRTNTHLSAASPHVTDASTLSPFSAEDVTGGDTGADARVAREACACIANTAFLGIDAASTLTSSPTGAAGAGAEGGTHPMGLLTLIPHTQSVRRAGSVQSTRRLQLEAYSALMRNTPSSPQCLPHEFLTIQ